MDRTATLPQQAYRALRRALLRRRLQRIEPRLRVEIAAIAALIAGFLFWQLRLRFAGIAYVHGPAGVARDLAAILLALAVGAGVSSGVRFTRIVLRGGVGPTWLALPLAPPAVRGQFAWESRLVATWAALPAAAAAAAAVGLAHPAVVALAAAGFVALLALAARAGCVVADRILSSGSGIERRLAYRTRRGGPRRDGATAWRRVPAPVALWLKDALLLARSSRLRGRLAPAVGFALLSAAVWFVPDLGRGAHAIAFAVALLAAGAFGEWILALSGADPFQVLRSLPVDARSLWISRMLWAVLGTVVLLALHAGAAGPLAPSARAFFLAWLGMAGIAVLALAVHYAQTVFPRAEQAQRLYELALGLAVVGSLLIPLLGWIVLLTAVIHSALRLRRWATIEDRP